MSRISSHNELTVICIGSGHRQARSQESLRRPVCTCHRLIGLICPRVSGRIVGSDNGTLLGYVSKVCICPSAVGDIDQRELVMQCLCGDFLGEENLQLKNYFNGTRTVGDQRDTTGSVTFQPLCPFLGLILLKRRVCV